MCQETTIMFMENINKSLLNKKIGLKVKFERLKRELSQEQLSELADLNSNTIGRIERNEISPTIVTIEKIAYALGMTFLELVDVSKFDL